MKRYYTNPNAGDSPLSVEMFDQYGVDGRDLKFHDFERPDASRRVVLADTFVAFRSLPYNNWTVEFLDGSATPIELQGQYTDLSTLENAVTQYLAKATS